MKKYKVTTKKGYVVRLEAEDLYKAREYFVEQFPTVLDYEIKGPDGILIRSQGCNPPPEQLQDEQPK